MDTIKRKKQPSFALMTNILFILSASFINFAFAQEVDREKNEEIEFSFTKPFTKTGSDRLATFLKDARGKQFVVKRHSPERAIHEAASTKFGASVGIPINHVKIFPPQSQETKDYSNGLTTTLHTWVPGQGVNTHMSAKLGKYYLLENGEYNRFDIKGGLKDNENLETITRNPDLCDIVALDIFVNNFDRHNGNLFVDRLSSVDERFYGIDMDMAYTNISLFSSSYDKDGYDENRIVNNILSSDLLATRAYDFLEEQDNKRFSPKEIKALKRVNETLGKLINKYSSVELYNEWMNIAKQANYDYSPIKKENIQIALEYNLHEVKRLHSKINTIVAT